MAAHRDPDEIQQEIERELEALARNIDAIGDRVSPSNVVHRTGARAREEVKQLAVTVGSIVAPIDEEGGPLTPEQRQRVLMVGGAIVLGAVVLFVGRRLLR